MKEPQPSDFPLKENTFLQPTSVYYVHADSSFSSKVAVYKLSASKVTLESVPTIEAARHQALSLPPMLQLQQNAWYSLNRSVRATDSEGGLVAEITGSLLSLGHLKLTFPPGLPHSSHDIELRPTGMGRRADMFVKESVLYFWDMSSSSAVLDLFMVVGGQRLKIAELRRRNSRVYSGVLVLDERTVDMATAIMTCVAVLWRSESFRR